VIVATKGTTRLLRGGRALSALRAEHGVAGSAVAPAAELGVDWPSDPDVLADCAVPGATHRWQTADELGRLVAVAGPAAYVLIAAAPAAGFECLERPGVALGRAISPVVVHGELLIVGPVFSAGRWPCRSCWARRLVANLPALGARVRRRHTVLVADEAVLGRWLATARTLWEARAPSTPRDRALVIDTERGTVHAERVLPMPGCHCLRPPATVAVDELVGRCFGSIQAVGTPPHPLGTGVTVSTARIRQGADRRVGGAAVGAAVDPTRQRAIAEAIERMAAETRPQGTYRASLDALPWAPRPDELEPYTRDQYDSPGFPYRPLDPGSLRSWVDGIDLLSGARRAVPLAAVTFVRDEIDFAPRSSTGRAAGPSWPAAVERALLEVAERDVVTRRWYEGEAIEVDPTEWAPAEQRLAAAAGLETRLAVCVDDDVPAAVAAVADTRAGVGALGSATAVTFAGAAPHAVEEALLMYAHRWSRSNLLPMAGVWFVDVGPEPRLPGPAVRFEELLRRYRPVAVALTTPEAAAAGLHVAGLWSPTAVDFPRPDTPLPLARWAPGAMAARRIASVPGAFVGDSPATGARR